MEDPGGRSSKTLKKSKKGEFKNKWEKKPDKRGRI